MARQRPLAEVLWTIYDQTGFPRILQRSSRRAQRQANLIELHDRARQFGTFRRQGLGRFLEFLQKLQADADLGQASLASDADDVVRIQSIHRSKGLEFPVVILPDLGKKINFQDASGSVLLDRAAGLGLEVIDLERQIRYPSLASTVVRQRIRQQTIAEELRVLYVAMTRAREHLILVGTCGEKQPEQWISRWENHVGAIPAQTVLAAHTMLDWLGPAAVLSNGMLKTELHAPEEIAQLAAQATAEIPVDPKLAALEAVYADVPRSPLAAEITDRLTAKYPFQSLTIAPAAVSVTSLSKQQATPMELDRQLPLPPAFAGLAPLDAADRGTATHLVLEHLDFSDAAGVEAILRQVRRMLDSHRLDSRLAGSVDLAAIDWLMHHDVGQLLRTHAADLLREIPIYFPLASSQPSDDPLDQTMVRGRLDVLVPVGEQYIIVDYKTDRVSGDGIDQRAEIYRSQLRLYREAIQRITGKRIAKSILVFLHPRECREV